MTVISWEDFVGSDPGPRRIAATVGVFDGLHRGHRILVERVVARGAGLVPAVFTFRDNPKRIMRPAAFQGDIMSLGAKLDSLEALGVGLCVLIDFSGKFSTLAGEDFLSLLRDRGRTEYLAVGADFRCGHGLDTDTSALSRLCALSGMDFFLLEAVMRGGHPVSSSRIRQAVLDGRLEEAEDLLGRPWELDLRGLDPLDGNAFAWRRPAGLALPPAGIYAARIDARGEGVTADGPAASGHGAVLEIGLDFVAIRDLSPPLTRAASPIRLIKSVKR